MVGITSDGYNFNFIWQNVEYYVNGSWLWYLFPVILFIAFVFGKRKYRLIAGYPYLIFFLTVCNPVLIAAAGKFIGLEDRYYRFFWFLPLGIALGILTVKTTTAIKWKPVRAAAVVFFGMLLLLGGVPVYFSEDSPAYRLRDNNYYTTETVIKLSEELHKSSVVNPVVIYPNEMVYDMCQYDGNLISVLTRGEAEDIWSYVTTERVDQAIAENNYEYILKYIYLTGWTDRITSDKFREALKETGVDYIVLAEESKDSVSFYQQCGCVVTGTVDSYTVLYTEHT